MKKLMLLIACVLVSEVATQGFAAEQTPYEKLAAKVDMLDGTQWTVEVKPRDGDNSVESDVLRFVGNNLVLDSLQAQGFPPTNYTPTLGRTDDVVILQTMKKHAKGDTAFIRAEVKGDRISGVISRETKRGKRKTWLFKGQQEKAKADRILSEPPPPAAMKQKPVVVEKEDVPESSQEEPSKAKLPWWRRLGTGAP